jgi:putative copper export protein
MVWVGGVLTLVVLSKQVLREREPDALVRFVASIRVMGPRVFAPASILVLGMGVWMVRESPEWAIDQGWVLFGLGLFAAAFLIGAIFQSRAAVQAQRAIDSGDLEQAARQLRRWKAEMVVLLIILGITAWDMVFKPWV